MAPVGPQLPPSLREKRKRSDEDDTDDSGSDSDSDTGPAPPVSLELPPKRARVIGPTLPPAPLSEKPIESPDPQPSDGSSDDSDDSDDDFGPSLPSKDQNEAREDMNRPQQAQATPSENNPAPSKRDDWMMVPPVGDDWTGRVDPTKLKNRKFNTGKGAKAPPTRGDASNTWHETPAEKQARLQREMMGIKDTSSQSDQTGSKSTTTAADIETARRMQEYNKSRGPALYEAHQNKQGIEKDDDPSARAFDREKDIGGGLQLNSTQRRDMMKKASDFGSRFSSAKYL